MSETLDKNERSMCLHHTKDVVCAAMSTCDTNGEREDFIKLIPAIHAEIVRAYRINTTDGEGVTGTNND